jgi:hypothetical protein
MIRNQTTNTLRLGRFIKEYKSSGSSLRTLIFVVLVCLLIASIFFIGAFSEARTREWGGVVALSLIGALFLLPVVLGIYVLFRGRGASLSLFEHGLYFRRGGKESTTTWDEIDSYMQETACRITRRDGEVIEFGQSLRDAGEIAEKIQEETLKRMLPDVTAAIRRGSTVEFKGWTAADKIPLGKGFSNYMEAHTGFIADAGGVTDKDSGNRILWREIIDFGISEETRGPRIKLPISVLYLTGANQTFRTRYGLLGNAHVLLALCAVMTGRADS